METRLQRLYHRDPNGWDLKDKEKHALGHDKMEDFLIKFEIPYVAVDTDLMNPTQVFETVKQHVLQLPKGRKR